MHVCVSTFHLSCIFTTAAPFSLKCVEIFETLHRGLMTSEDIDVVSKWCLALDSFWALKIFNLKEVQKANTIRFPVV
jgi:hypothetical protein